jgi:hypothetical protein
VTYIRIGVLILVLVLALAGLGHAIAGDIRVPTRAYQLDSGQFVRTWLDEPLGVWCAMLLDGQRPVGISCVPITGTTYAWPVQPGGK